MGDTVSQSQSHANCRLGRSLALPILTFHRRHRTQHQIATFRSALRFRARLVVFRGTVPAVHGVAILGSGDLTLFAVGGDGSQLIINGPVSAADVAARWCSTPR